MQARQAIGTLLPVLVMTLGGGCGDEDRVGAGDGRGIASGCNVLLITLDTTRADRLGCYGWTRAVTPTLDALAHSGVRFEKVYAQAPITLPSHVTMMTGTYPPEHGVRDNGRYALGPELTTLAEVFQRHGYRTAAFIACQVLDSRYGLARGFEVYDDRMPLRTPDQAFYDRPADRVCDNVLSWLPSARGGPFFCWVHLFDPHAPYTPPAEYLDQAGSPYDGEVAFMDANISRLIEWLRANELLANTLVIAVADHGESLGEHGYGFHALLVYDGIMRVPLIFSLPGRLPADVTRTGIVRVVDVMPTILDLMGWETPPEVSGESLLAALSGEETAQRAAYVESDFPFESFGWSKLRSLVEERWKYIRAPRRELYDLLADPGELRNLAETQTSIVKRMEKRLGELEQRMQRRTAVAVEVDTDTMRALRGLGYVGGGAPAGAPTANLKNPADMVDVVDDFRRAETLLDARRALEVIELMEPAAECSPESFVIVELLARAYAGAGILECAQGLLHEALAIRPEAPGPLIMLARVYDARGAAAQAIEACSKVLEYEPDHQEARNLLPALQRALERQEQRLGELRQRFRAGPESVDTCLSLARALLGAGQTGEALDVLRAGLARNPDDARLASELAWQLATTPADELRNGAEAVRLARTLCREAGESRADLLDTLGAALAEAGQFEQAADAARRAGNLAKEAGQQALSIVIARRLRLYQAQRPYRSPP